MDVYAAAKRRRPAQHMIMRPLPTSTQSLSFCETAAADVVYIDAISLTIKTHSPVSIATRFFLQTFCTPSPWTPSIFGCTFTFKS